MAKKFDIHEWQSKQKLNQYLAEQLGPRMKNPRPTGPSDDFTPDLEDDELKRGAIQQMMSTEKGLQKDDYKLVNSVSNIADVYSYGEILDALESFYTKNDEQQSAEMARKHAKESRDFLDTMDKYEKRYGTSPSGDLDGDEEYSDVEKAWDNLSSDEQINIIGDAMNGEPRPSDYEKKFDQLKSEIPDFEETIANYVGLNEQNVTGTGTSFTAGPSGTGPYATPNAFGKNKNKKGPFNTKSGYMGYTEPVKNK